MGAKIVNQRFPLWTFWKKSHNNWLSCHTLRDKVNVTLAKRGSQRNATIPAVYGRDMCFQKRSYGDLFRMKASLFKKGFNYVEFNYSSQIFDINKPMMKYQT
jgi:hypothetical protein